MAENIYNPEYVKGLFNRMSSSYERMNFITSFGFSIRWRRQFLNPFQPTKDKIEIIDLLTGMGETWNSVKHKFPNSTISALDFSTEMLKNAKNKSKKHYKNEVILLQQDVLENELLSNKYDFVICAFGLKTFNNEQLEILAKETKRILKIGGQFSFIEVSKPDPKIINFFYRFYLGKVIPILGKLLLGNPNEYKMLWKYTDKFENAKKATEIFNKMGLQAKYVSFFYGCSTGFNGEKLSE
jgi:demethylmenaquinone methyltransferase/2-methoxy-6-polyprenyl-1,4-benzoquinol methylase